ncbi:3'-5' DNA helicase [Schaereria dolodes]|nr:3'-5' DNA helicase [Schaereria dolodes]
MESSGEDEYGDVNDEEMMAAATQVECAGITSYNSSLEDSLVYPASKRRRLSQPRRHESETDEADELDSLASLSPVRPMLNMGGKGFSESPENKPKSRHKIHIPKQAEIPKDVFYTQVPRSSQSPYRIRGPHWQKPKPRSPSPPPSGKQRPATSTAEVGTSAPLFLGTKRSTNIHSPQIFAAGKNRYRDTDGGVNDNSNKSVVLPNATCGHLADIPSDAFASPSLQGSVNQSVKISSQFQKSLSSHTQFTQGQRLMGPQTNLRQTTLFGGQAQNIEQSQSQSTRRHNWPLANREELPTHHKLDLNNLKSWVYPTNLGTIRDYQYNIVARGLYHNLLVALPTGLGKTFIAAAIMLNWYRWTTDAQIVFVAPTKPLVSQQVEACFNIVGIPRSATTMLTGNTPPGIRAEEWMSKRVFFMTPQTIINDLKTGICDPKRTVLLVVDEAHRATGGYAYVEVVKFLRRFNTSFRVLALTATPGSSVEGVQEVIDGLGIQRVEIRTEESIDIRQYVHTRKIDTVLFENSDEMVMVMDLFSRALQPVLSKLNGMNAYWAKDPMTLTPYGCTQARQKWMATDAGRKANMGTKGMVNTIFSLLASLSHATELLKFHGIGPFFRKVTEFRNGTQNGEKGSKYSKQINESESFRKLMSRVQSWVNNPEFVGHPKLEYLRSVVMNHFLDAGDARGAADGAPPSSTRIMVFVHYRDSAEEVARVLKRNEPMIRPHVFVGQANSKGSDGMDQKKQLNVIQKFKDGIYNTLVATSIGEEGLDIGEVDLIVCYDASASPIRMLQRMGRTGRKRAGNIVVTLMKGKEENNFVQAKDNYEKMQQMIAAGTRFTFHNEQSPRIVPKDIQPVVDKKRIEIPLENTQSELPEPRKRARAPKRPPKKFHMPDGVRTGFTKASRLDDDEASEASDFDRDERSGQPRSTTPEPIPSLDEVLLTVSEDQELERNYLDVGGDTPQIVEMPRLDAFPALQRSLRRSKYVEHGRATKRIVGMLNLIHNVNEMRDERYAKSLQLEDQKMALAQIEQRAAFFNRPSSELQDTHTQFTSSSQLSRQSLETPYRRGKSRSIDTPPIDVSFDSDDVIDQETNEETVDFINDDLDEHIGAPSSTSSPSPLITPGEPFYETLKISHDSSEAEDHLPEISTLLKRREEGLANTLIQVERSTIEILATQSQRKGRRLVVEDDSDDE